MNRSATTMSGKTKIKIVFLGDQSVGKSSIIEKYVKDTFDETSHPTVGIDFLVKNVSHAAKMYRLQLWDTAGQQRFRSLIPNYLKDAKCAFIVVDVSNKVSLNNADMWLKLYNDNRTVQGYSFLIANKIDLEYRQIQTQEGKKKAEELGIPYCEISAKTGENIEDMFLSLIDVVEQRGASFDFSKSKPPTIKEEEENQKEEESEVKEQQKNKEQNIVEDAGKQHNIVLKSERLKKPEEGKEKKQKCC